jgi:hypothetical protein
LCPMVHYGAGASAPASLIQPWGLSKLLENFEGTSLGAIAEASAGKSIHA